MTTSLGKAAVGWGFLLWLIGYLLGFIVFFIVPQGAVGWVIMPIGILLVLWVLYRKIAPLPMGSYIAIAISWTLIAVVLDYFFLVKLLNPADGYYKLDVYLYYALTFILPILVGWRRAPKPAVPMV